MSDDLTLTPAHLSAYTRFLQLQERAQSTVDKYLRDVRSFAVWAAGRPVTQDLAAAWREHLLEWGCAPVTVNAKLSALNGLFRCLGWEECRVKFLRLQRRAFRDRGRELTRGEYRRLLTAAGEQGRLALLMETICATGIRVSELRFFTVEAVRAGRAEVCNKGKSRTVFLPGKLQKVLLKYVKAQKIAAGPVFVTRTGRPLDRSNIWSDMKKLCQAAHVAESKVFPHNLRHLFARTYYGLEKDIVRLADILGHSSINTTRIYTMESGRTHRRQLERMQLVI